MSGTHVYTSFTYSYLGRACVLAESIRRHHPSWTIWALLVDRPPAGFSDTAWRSEFDVVLDAATLFPGEWEDWISRHSLVEACTGVKGRALEHILADGADKVFYLDPDIAVFGSLDALEQTLDRASVVLTPHLTEPNVDELAFIENDLVSMRYGVYNLGFLGVRNDETGRTVAAWWSRCLNHACTEDTSTALFTDQKYFDLLPGLFPAVHIERDPGYNVASWNLSRRKLAIGDDGAITVNGRALRFYHFTKINSDGDAMTEKYADGNLAVFEVWTWYKRAIADRAPQGLAPGYWAYRP